MNGLNWLRSSRSAKAGALFLILIGVCALLASFLASDHPILLKRQGKLYWFPNLGPPAELKQLRNADFKKELTSGESSWAIFPLVSQGPDTIDLDATNQAPGRHHWLGTDDLGRDVLARIIFGSRISLLVGVGSVALYLLLGTLIGFVAGYYEGTADLIVSRLIEIVLAFPALVLVLAITGLARSPGMTLTLLAIAAVKWASVAQLVRGEVTRLRSEPFIVAARSLGAGDARILIRHLLPNLVGMLAVTATFGMAGAVLIEGFISFLGFGGTSVSWGVIFAHADLYSLDNWWVAMFPGLFLFLTVLAYHFIGEALEAAYTPQN